MAAVASNAFNFPDTYLFPATIYRSGISAAFVIPILFVISNIVGAELGAIRVGQSVRAEFETGLDPALPRVLFRPEPLSGGAP